MLPGSREKLDAAWTIGSRVRRRSRGGNRVPEQWLFARAPLSLEAVGPRIAARSTKVKSPKTLRRRASQRFPIEKHVGAQREVLLQAGRPGNSQSILERDGNEAPDRQPAFQRDQHTCACAEMREHRGEKTGGVNRRSEVTHANGKNVIERVQPFNSTGFNRQARSLRLANLVADLFVQLTPPPIGVARHRQRHVDLVFGRLAANVETLRRA